MTRLNEPHLPQGKIAEHPLMLFLIKRRLQLGWTQKELAKRSGYSQASVDSWERGVRTPSLERWDHLAKTLSVGIRLEELDS